MNTRKPVFLNRSLWVVLISASADVGSENGKNTVFDFFKVVLKAGVLLGD